MDFPNASAQERFLIMLQERLDKLTDEVRDLRDLSENNLMSIHADTESCQNFKCSDIGCVASAAFIKIITPNENSINQIKEIIQKFKGLKAFTFHSGRISNYSEFVPEDANVEFEEEEEENPDAFIVQVLVCFKHSIVASRLGVEICKNLNIEETKIELEPIYDFHVFEQINQEIGLFKYYYYNIVALQNNKHPAIIGEDNDVNWYNPDGTYETYFFMGNIPGGDNNYIDMLPKLENRNINFSIWPHKYKN